MGFADWKLVFFLSLLLKNPMENLLFVFGSFWIGALYAIPSLIFKKGNLKSEVPFGPFIILSFLITFLFSLSYYDFVELLAF
jgi:prepilin signal peptidase PulO-like enzyme (type II secretory pathway)